MEPRKYSFYVYLGLIIFLAILAILIIRPFFTTVVFAAVFAYWLAPLHQRLAKYIRPMPSAIIISVLLFIVLLSIMQYGLFVFLREVGNISNALSNVSVSDVIAKLFNKEIMSTFTVKSILSNIAATFTSKATSLLYEIPAFIISFLTFVLTFFYLLLDGPKISTWLKKNIPFPKDKRKKMVASMRGYMNAFLKAHIIIGILQGIICAIGFYIFGLGEYVLIGALAAALLSVLPIIGPYILYVPTGIIIALQGHTGLGVGLIIYGLAFGSLLDYVVRPEITGKYASMHPLAVLLGVLGGIAVFGLVGVFIGPIVLGLCMTIMETLTDYRIPKIIRK